MTTAGKRAKSPEENGFCVSEKLTNSGEKLPPGAIVHCGDNRAGSPLFRRYLVWCLYFTDGKMEAHDYTICKKIIKPKAILSVFHTFEV